MSFFFLCFVGMACLFRMHPQDMLDKEVKINDPLILLLNDLQVGPPAIPPLFYSFSFKITHTKHAHKHTHTLTH